VRRIPIYPSVPLTASLRASDHTGVAIRFLQPIYKDALPVPAGGLPFLLLQERKQRIGQGLRARALPAADEAREQASAAVGKTRACFVRRSGCRAPQTEANKHCPVAVPGVRLGDDAPALPTDRCHSLSSLFPPLAAVASLPRVRCVPLRIPSP